MFEVVIWSFFKKKGLSGCGVAGLMGNPYAESGLKPDNLQNTCEKKPGLSDADYTAQVDAGTYQDFVRDNAGYGLAQWVFWSRKQKLFVFALSRGKSIGDLEMQLDSLWKELTESYPSLVSILETAVSVRMALDVVLAQFERPADQNEMAKTRRAAYGQKYYDQFVGRGEAMSSTTTLPAVECVLATARAEIGYIERKTNAQFGHKTANAGDKNWDKHARDLDALGTVYNGRESGYSWCDTFVDWCHIHTFGLEPALKLLCQARNNVEAGRTDSTNYYKQKGRFYAGGPQPGDQIFFMKDGGKSFYHIGIVEKVSDGRVYTIEGSTSPAADVVENGGCVRDKSYPMAYDKIGDYGRLDYSTVSGENGDMDQTKFNEMFGATMTNYPKGLQNNNCGDWFEEARVWAESMGLFAGNSTAVNDKSNMMWPPGPTRKQVARFFYRFTQMVGLA